jgi:hypothetical protein
MNKNQIKDEQLKGDSNEWLSQMEEMKTELVYILKITRGMPGLEIRTIADSIRIAFDEAEIKALIKELCINNKTQNKNQ